MADTQWNINTEVRTRFGNFLASHEGELFIHKLDSMIDEAHSNAENNPELSRDYTQRAKGIRSVKEELIALSVVVNPKGVRPKK